MNWLCWSYSSSVVVVSYIDWGWDKEDIVLFGEYWRIVVVNWWDFEKEWMGNG